MESHYHKSEITKRNMIKIIVVVIIFITGLISGMVLSSKYHKVFLKAKRALLHYNSYSMKKGAPSIINSFETDKDLVIWEKKKIPFSRSSEYASKGKHSLKVVFPKDEYPGISSIFRPEPEDWSEFRYLKLDVYNPQNEEVKFCIIIKDKGGETYSKRYDGMHTLVPGINNLVIDLSQLRRNTIGGYLKLDSIIQYVFCLVKPESETVIYFDNMRVEALDVNEKSGENITVTVDAGKVYREINPLIFGSNLAPKTTYTYEVSQFIRDTGLTIFRYPGGDPYGYHWKTGTFDFWTNKPYMFPLGKYDNVVAFCKDTNTQLVIEINLESGTPQEAAEWVKYTNKELGFYVQYWELGSEPYGDWDNCYRTATEYAKNLEEYSKAMKAVDPTIKIGAAWAEEAFGDWDRVVMRNAGEFIDFISCHWYPNHTHAKKKYNDQTHPDPLDVAANGFRVPQIIQRMKSIIDQECPERQGKIEFTFLEWDGAWDAPTYNPKPYAQGIVQWSLANALFYAETFGQFIKQGVTLSTNFKFQECPFGLIRGHLTEWEQDNVEWDGKTIRPKAHVIKLFRKHFGSSLVASELKNSPSYVKSPDWYTSYSGEVPYISCFASRNESGNKLYLMIINRHPKEDLPINFEVKNFEFKDKVNIWILNGPEITSQNDGSPGNVDITHEGIELSGPNFKYISPAHSVVSIELDKAAIEREDEDI